MFTISVFTFNLFIHIHLFAVANTLFSFTINSSQLARQHISVYIRVLSANIFMPHSSVQNFITLFIYTINYNGPKTDPCGTPYLQLVATGLNQLLLNCTYCVYYLSTNVSIPKQFLLNHIDTILTNLSLSIVLNAYLRSMNITPIHFPLTNH